MPSRSISPPIPFAPMAFLLLGICPEPASAVFGQEAAKPSEPQAASRSQVLTSPWFWRNMNGEPKGGEVERIDTEGVTWRAADASKTDRIAWNEITELRRNSEVVVDASQPPAPGPVVLLPEKDSLRGEAVATLTQGLAVESVSIGIVNIPLAQWAGFLSLPPETPTKFMRTVEALRRGSDTPGDLVLLANGDRVQCTILELDAENVKVQPTGAAKPVSLPRKGVQGVAVDAATLEYPAIEGSGWKVVLTDGSRITAKAVFYDAGDPEKGLNLTTRWGAQWRVPIANLAAIRVLHPGAVELDSIKPAAIQTVDYVGPTMPPRFGANIQGGPLRIGNRNFDQGIGMQSRTLMAYRLDGSKKTFTAWVGLENSAGPAGSARAVVLLDGKPVYDSGPLKAGELPRRVQVDLGSARLLILSSEFGEGGGVRDWVNWCEPTLNP